MAQFETKLLKSCSGVMILRVLPQKLGSWPTMSSAIDLYYRLPRDIDREHRLIEKAVKFGGRLDSVETKEIATIAHAVCVTFEFADSAGAERCAQAFRVLGEHVEGPYGYA